MHTSTAPTAQDSLRSGSWRIARYSLLSLATLVTLIAVFYTVENWRGQRAWDSRRRQLEAKGEALDWTAYIPAPVADDQNFFKAPNMQEWFVKGSFYDENSSAGHRTPLPNEPKPFTFSLPESTPLVIAEVSIAVRNGTTNPQTQDAVLSLEDPQAREKAAHLLRKAIGPCVIGARNNSMLLAQPLDQFKPLHLVIQANTALSVKELVDFFPKDPMTGLAMAYSTTSYIQVVPAGGNAFRVLLKAPVAGAADLLESTAPLTADFDRVRKALARPFARIDCDYQQPYAIWVPNFIHLRSAVQILAMRAQCYLLLKQPEAAWHELALVHDLCQILKAKPSGKPITLVSAMINVAITGLYAAIIHDGLRLHAWDQPQLLNIERQLNETDLLSPVQEAFREERAAIYRTLEITSRRELVKMFNTDRASRLGLTWIPRGWFYQNMVRGADLEQTVLSSLDPTNQMVMPHELSRIVHSLSSEAIKRSPYTFLLALAFPNFTKAVQTTARNQTLVNQARIACALERYRLTKGHYPEALQALEEQPGEKLPHDVVGGQPMKYQRIKERGYLLYSIGWNEKDDRGSLSKSPEEGDWVWELRAGDN